MTTSQKIKFFQGIDNWTSEQCRSFMFSMNGESKHLEEIANNLEFYREHCRYIFRDRYNITDQEIAHAIGQS